MKSNTLYIGGEFAASDLEPFYFNKPLTGKEYFPEEILRKKRHYFETGTDSIAAILREVNTEKPLRIWFPENYCRHTIERIIVKSGIRLTTEHYKKLEISFSNEFTEVLMAVHFNRYDKAVADQIKRIQKEYNPVIIEDFVHAPFEIAEFAGDYAINSLRKIGPIELSVTYLNEIPPSGNSVSDYYSLKAKGAKLKADFLKTGDKSLEEEYLSLFRQAEYNTEPGKIYKAQKAELEKLENIDFNKIIEARKKNYNALKKHLTGLSQLRILPGEYMYLMIHTNKRDELRSHLFKNNIFAPIHWADSSSEISKEIMSLPIDQRYSDEDMRRVFLTIKEFFDNGN